jgi:hypothetical protein
MKKKNAGVAVDHAEPERHFRSEDGRAQCVCVCVCVCACMRVHVRACVCVVLQVTMRVASDHAGVAGDLFLLLLRYHSRA